MKIVRNKRDTCRPYLDTSGNIVAMAKPAQMMSSVIGGKLLVKQVNSATGSAAIRPAEDLSAALSSYLT